MRRTAATAAADAEREHEDHREHAADEGEKEAGGEQMHDHAR
jgi:hypothetical protein